MTTVYGDDMDVLYLAASGPSDPTRASIPWHLAVNGSVEAGQSTAVVLLGDAARGRWRPRFAMSSLVSVSRRSAS